jgi:hypothetical protein
VRTINEIIIHHTDSAFGDVAQIRAWHTAPPPAGNGWQDIGYHFVILNGVRRAGDKYCAAEDGMIETGRPIDVIGAHCKGHNTGSIGISLVGKDTFTPRQFSTLAETIKQLKGKYPISSVVGHNFYAETDCPAFNWQQFLRTI